MSPTCRKRFIVQGRVQGVGFRPFVWRLARRLNLTGYIRNTSAGVEIEIQGSESKLNDFEGALQKELPPLARIGSIKQQALTVRPEEKDFQIAQSQGHAGQNVLVSPDVGICAECLADIRDPGNFRHAYPFANCVNCGPRYTITSSIPYDRPSTSMACFELCPNCAAEYNDPANRRFHAQPIACAQCGPQVWYVDRHMADAGNSAKNDANMANALARAGQAIVDGKILALKGLGGFQLVCNARDARAVATLRERKSRPHKALAVMTRDAHSLATFTNADASHLAMLESPEKPIILCPALPGTLPGIAPDLPHIGVMFPYTPLHALLLDWLQDNGLANPVLVMTSGNPKDEPICLGNREAISRLRHFADCWLLHDRDILTRVDDSVVLPTANSESYFQPGQMLRRARSYTPVPIVLPGNAKLPAVLGVGGDLKGSFCLTRANQAFMGQHIGDLSRPKVMDFYEEALEHLEKLLETSPRLIVHDLHPNFTSTAFARNLAARLDLPLLPLQHHAAHAASVLGENNVYEPALALCLDGTGLGEDGTIWGGELLLMDLGKAEWSRVGSFTPFALPGAEQAIEEPWRIALALGRQAGITLSAEYANSAIILQMLDKGLNCPQTSSCGRLFDAVSAMLGLCNKITYEGQAAMRLMNEAWPLYQAGIARNRSSQGIDYLLLDSSSSMRMDSVAIFRACHNFYQASGDKGASALFFHELLAYNLAALCEMAAQKHGTRKVGLSGGVMHNFILLDLLLEQLKARGLAPLFHAALPAGDGGLAFGQAIWGLQCFANKKIAI